MSNWSRIRRSFRACSPRAMRTAIEERGVAVIVLPGDVALSEAPDEAPRVDRMLAPPTLVPAEADLDRLADLLNEFEARDAAVRQRLRGRA